MRQSYLVVTEHGAWGKGLTEKEALKKANMDAIKEHPGDYEYNLEIFRFPPELVKRFKCDDEGNILFEYKEGVPQEIEKLSIDPFRVGRFKRRKHGTLKAMN